MNISTRPQNELAAMNKRMMFILAGVAVAILLLAVVFSGGPGDVQETEFHTVKRSDFMVTVVEGGELSAVNETVLRSEVDGTARIIYIVDEGSNVKKGDLLVELDASDLVDRINQQEIDFEKSVAAYKQAEANLEIAKSTLESNIRNASNALLFARIDLEKYIDGDYQQTLLTTSNNIVSFEQNMKVAKDQMDNSRKLFEKGFETQTNLERDQLSYTNVLFNLRKEKESLRLFQSYEHPKSLATFQSGVADAEDELERVKLEGAGNMAKAEADLAAQLNSLNLTSNVLERLKIQLNNSKIYAPQDGLVVYAVSNNRWSSESLIEEGATIRNRQEIIKLPDVSKMKVDLKIHESNIGQVRKGQVAYIILDPTPDKRHKGYVSKVGVVPEAASRWGGSDMKMYATEVIIDDVLEGIKPGVSAQVEIITTNLTDVVTVPTQCVTTVGEKTVVYRETSGGKVEPVPVKLGVYDDKYIQVVEGLNAGDRIMVSPPLNYESEDLDRAVIRDGEELDTEPKEVKETAPAGGNRAQQQQQQGGGDQNAMREQMLKRFDTDGDGKLSESEREAMRSQFGGGGGGRNGGSGGAGAGGGGR